MYDIITDREKLLTDLIAAIQAAVSRKGSVYMFSPDVDNWQQVCITDETRRPAGYGGIHYDIMWATDWPLQRDWREWANDKLDAYVERDRSTDAE